MQRSVSNDERTGNPLFKWVKNNSLSIIFFSFFLICIVFQSITGFHAYNETLTAHAEQIIGFKSYLGTGNFLDGIFVNLQAAILQLGCLIVFTGVLRQKGASHSLKPDKAVEKEREKKEQKVDKQVPWVYRYSLSLAFILVFLGSFIGHIVFGTRSFNETAALTGEEPISIASFLHSSTFGFMTLQTWQAEFLSLGIFLVFSIYLRQEGSSESKPVNSSNEDTGGANE